MKDFIKRLLKSLNKLYPPQHTQTPSPRPSVSLTLPQNPNRLERRKSHSQKPADRFISIMLGSSRSFLTLSLMIFFPHSLLLVPAQDAPVYNWIIFSFFVKHGYNNLPPFQPLSPSGACTKSSYMSHCLLCYSSATCYSHS